MKKSTKWILILALTTIFLSEYIFRMVISTTTPIYRRNNPYLHFTEKVEVYTDKYSVPHIFAENERDLFFVAGYIAARERLFQLSMVALAVKGELASVLGDSYLKTDVYLRTWRIEKVATQLVKAMNPNNKIIFESFCDGINHWIKESKNDLPVEFKILGMEPFCGIR